jgi:hypothetical protein
MHGKMEWDSIKVDLEDIGWEDVGTVCQDINKDKMAVSCDHRNYPSGSKNPGEQLLGSLKRLLCEVCCWALSLCVHSPQSFVLVVLLTKDP